jgi:3alpha(or 20beta)-hydroxysteroid dehydrogenase
MALLDGKTAIITGAAGGIGAATARLMVERGASVLLADINLSRRERLPRKSIEPAAYAVHSVREFAAELTRRGADIV